MPTIYARFTEKEARQWRQIYKGLVLLESVLAGVTANRVGRAS